MIGFRSLPSYTSNHEKLLDRQEITKEDPGPVLRDLETMLSVIGDEGVPVSESQHAISRTALPSLNAQLSHPIETEYKRLQQSAFPPIAGLNLLLRAAGMAQPREVGGSFRLVLNEAVVASWRDLNPTEQYFALLEAWLNRANEDQIFDQRGKAFDGNLRPALTLITETQPTPLGAKLDDSDRRELKRRPGELHLALMWLFGLVDLDEAGTMAGEPWQVQRITVEPYGKALLLRIANAVQEKAAADDDSAWDFDRESFLLSARDLRRVLQPYFPAYDRTLPEPHAEFRPDTHVFDVELERRRGEPVGWRMAFPGASTLHEVSETILDAVGFDRAHLYRFRYQDVYGWEQAVNTPDSYQEPPYADEVQVGDLPLAPGETLSYLYDFGESWEFALRLDEIGDERQEVEEPTVLEAYGDPPDQYHHPVPEEWK